MEKASAPHRSRRMRRPAKGSEQQVRANLDDVRRIIGVDTQPVAKVLPEAIVQATEERAAAVATALEPAVARSIRVVATRESHWFGEILAPTIGVAVRKAIHDAIARLMQRFNVALERSLSLRSFQWRLEARRTGRPFAEVVLLRTLVYRVEQVFLIHTETGLVLQHVVAEGLPSAQPDQVASMLAAIDAFGREAFAPSPPGVYLHEFSMGDLTVWVDRAAPIAVALVIRGRAPRSLLDDVTETRERILLEYGESLSHFEADTTPFASTVPLLERCLQEQTEQVPQRGPVILLALVVVIVIAIGAFAGQRRHEDAAEEAELETYRQALGAEPGIIVTSSSRDDGRFRISGLRDPVAAEPAELVAGLGRGKPELAFEPFYSLDPRVIETRFRRATAPPETVTVAVQEGTLKIAGVAPREWIDRAVRVGSALPGVERVESTLSDASARELASATRQLDDLVVPFAHGSAELEPDAREAIARALPLIARVERLSAGLNLQSCIIVTGDSDASGGAAINERLERERAQAVAAALRRQTAPRAPRIEVRVRGETDAFPRSRSVHFGVRTGAFGATGCQEGIRG